MNNEELFKTLNKIFSDEKFLLDSATYGNRFIFSDLLFRLNTILCYYLTTRDSRILSLDDIYNNYSEIKNKVPSRKHLNNILKNGYLTHSFPGVEKKYIQDYGFDYLNKLSLDEKNKLQVIRESLLCLEKTIQECKYYRTRRKNNNQEIINREIFMTFPGTKTIYYSVFSPERLYRGPIDKNLFDKFPIVVGESKKDYLMRIMQYQIEKHSDKKSSHEEMLKAIDDILNYYIDYKNCIAFIGIKSILNEPIYAERYGYKGEDKKLKEYYSLISQRKYSLRDTFTSEMSDKAEFCNRGDFVTLSSNIDKDSISFVDFPDWYNLRQEFLKQNEIPEGTLVLYNDCTEIKRKDEISDDIKKLYKSRG